MNEKAKYAHTSLMDMAPVSKTCCTSEYSISWGLVVTTHSAQCCNKKRHNKQEKGDEGHKRRSKAERVGLTLFLWIDGKKKEETYFELYYRPHVIGLSHIAIAGDQEALQDPFILESPVFVPFIQTCFAVRLKS